MNSVHEAVRCLVRDLDGGMPSSTAVQEVKDKFRVDEHDVTFNLFVELVREIDRCNTIWKWLHPLATDCASVNDVWQEGDDLRSETCPLERC